MSDEATSEEIMVDVIVFYDADGEIVFVIPAADVAMIIPDDRLADDV